MKDPQETQNCETTRRKPKGSIPEQEGKRILFSDRTPGVQEKKVRRDKWSTGT